MGREVCDKKRGKNRTQIPRRAEGAAGDSERRQRTAGGGGERARGREAGERDRRPAYAPEAAMPPEAFLILRAAAHALRMELCAHDGLRFMLVGVDAQFGDPPA